MIFYRISVFFATISGIGFIKPAPGTVGTFIALVVYWIMSENILFFFYTTIPGLVIFTVLLLISVPILASAQKILGRDDSRIILDEFWGYLVSIAFFKKSMISAIALFILFRVFDICKIQPVKLMEKLPGGWGILADDVMAGVYANLSWRLILFLFPIIKLEYIN